METQFAGLKIGSMVQNKKTLKKWMITEFVTSYSSVKKQLPDEYKVRLSNGLGKNIIVTVDDLKKKYDW
jgi:hypothetical protein